MVADSSTRFIEGVAGPADELLFDLVRNTFVGEDGLEPATAIMLAGTVDPAERDLRTR
jgi:hypothetical protein